MSTRTQIVTVDGTTQSLSLGSTTTGMNGSAYIIPETIINSYSVLSIPAYARAMNFISENLASFPRSVRLNGAKPPTPHPLDKLLNRRPNAMQNSFVLWRTLYFHAAHERNGYLRIVRAGAKPIAILNVLPCDVMPFRYDAGDGTGMQQYFMHRPTKTAIPAADMIQIQGLSYDGLAGMDAISLHARTFQKAVTLEKYEVQYLRKGTMVRGAVEIPGSITPEQRAEIRATLRTFQGDEAQDDVLILSDAAKFNNTTTSPRDSQLAEQASLSTKRIAQITGVPPEFLFELTEAKYNTSVEQAGQNVVRYCLRPWIEQAEDELTLKLLTEAEQDEGYTIRINADALLRGDTTAVNNSAITTVNAGIRSKNEGRELLELPPDSDPESNKLKALGSTTPQTAPTTSPDSGLGGQPPK